MATVDVKKIQIRHGNEADLVVANLLDCEPVNVDDIKKFGIKQKDGTMLWAATLNAQGKLNQMPNATDVGAEPKKAIYSEMIFDHHDILNEGLQTITGLHGIPKRIEVRGAINTGPVSNGSWEAGNNSQSCNGIYPSTAFHPFGFYNNLCAILLAVNEQQNYITGKIQNVTAAQFDILWSKTVTSQQLSGDANLQFIVHY